jgi:hypothetical protein
MIFLMALKSANRNPSFVALYATGENQKTSQQSLVN